MRFAFDIAIAFLVAVVTGGGSAWLAVDHAPLFDPLKVGVWTAWPHAGATDADPYDLAALARSTDLPLGSGEGIAFTTATDDTGAPLDGNCTYAVSGNTPPAQLWTLTADGIGGRSLATTTGHGGTTSRSIVRRPDGSFVVTLAPRVQPGNWIAVAASARFRLALRLYDTPLTSAARPAALEMPAIRKVACQ